MPARKRTLSSTDRVARYVARRRTGATRQEIASATGLNYRTVSRATRTLRNRGAVVEAGKRNRAQLVHAIRITTYTTTPGVF